MFDTLKKEMDKILTILLLEQYFREIFEDGEFLGGVMVRSFVLRLEFQTLCYILPKNKQENNLYTPFPEA